MGKGGPSPAVINVTASALGLRCAPAIVRSWGTRALLLDYRPTQRVSDHGSTLGASCLQQHFLFLRAIFVVLIFLGHFLHHKMIGILNILL